MDPQIRSFSDSGNGFEINYDNLASYFPNLANDFKFEVPSPDLNFMENSLFLHELDQGEFAPAVSASSAELSSVASVSSNSDGGSFPLLAGFTAAVDSPSDDSEFSETVKYINQILMEENIEEKPCMFYDPLGLKHTEKSFYDVLNKIYPSSPNQPSLAIESPSSDHGSNGSTTSLSNYADRQWMSNFGETNQYLSQTSLAGESVFLSKVESSSQALGHNQNSLRFNGEDLVSELLAQNIYSNSESVLQFKKGLEEASKFLPEGNQLFLNSWSSSTNGEAAQTNDVVEKAMIEKENSSKTLEEMNSPNKSKGRKNREREDEDMYSEERRSNKQSAVYVDESELVDENELSEMFDRVLLHGDGKKFDGLCNGIEKQEDEACKKDQIKKEPQTANGGRARGKRQGKKTENVDLTTLLIQCAQSVTNDDRRSANELIKQIRQHSSPIGDGSQRLAHYFADALEARLAGTGTGTKLFFTSLASKKISAFDMLKSYQVNLAACPFKKISLFFANKMIFKFAEKAETLHIIDFGILYGFQWPILIQHLSLLPGGPPKLRITGIEFPQSGFRPVERIEETGHRLEKYCNRFNVPFEYNAIASHNWETIQIEDLKLRSNEVIAVNCLFRFKNLLDETVEENSPKNALLSLIRKINPNIFVHAIVNGSYNAPFFLTRFKEALFYYSALFDMFDTNISRENEQRMMFEREFFGREAMNVIACEGIDRVERPETYKQWQTRSLRAGFRQLPLDKEMMDKFRSKLKMNYHKDFVLDEDGNWMLQGWKGRIVYASSCWVPA